MLKILLHWSSLCSFVERTDRQKAGNTFKVALKFKVFHEFQKQFATCKFDPGSQRQQHFAKAEICNKQFWYYLAIAVAIFICSVYFCYNLAIAVAICSMHFWYNLAIAGAICSMYFWYAMPRQCYFPLSHRRRYGFQKELKEKYLQQWLPVHQSLFCAVKLGNLGEAKLKSSYSVLGYIFKKNG